MNLTTLREDLGQFLHRPKNGDDGDGGLELVLDALARKDAELQHRLATEQEPEKRHHLAIELEVTRLQHRKGVELRDASR